MPLLPEGLRRTTSAETIQACRAPSARVMGKCQAMVPVRPCVMECLICLETLFNKPALQVTRGHTLLRLFLAARIHTCLCTATRGRGLRTPMQVSQQCIRLTPIYGSIINQQEHQPEHKPQCT